MKTKEPRRGRPPKSPGERRAYLACWVPEDLRFAVDTIVEERREKAPGASRGDVVAEALRLHPRIRRRT